MGKSIGGTEDAMADTGGMMAPELQSGDYFDVSKLVPLQPNLSNLQTPIDQMQKVPGDHAQAKKVQKAVGSAISQIGSSLDQQQPQMVPAGPQVGSPLYQPQQTDAYAAYIKQLQQQQQPQYGNSFYGE
jgi:hypothetical protein